MDEYKWKLTKITPKNAQFAFGDAADPRRSGISECISPKNLNNELSSKQVFDLPAGLTSKSYELLRILANFSQITLINAQLRVNGKYLMKIRAFLNEMYRGKKISRKMKIILKILSERGGLSIDQLSKDNRIVYKKLKLYQKQTQKGKK